MKILFLASAFLLTVFSAYASEEILPGDLAPPSSSLSDKQKLVTKEIEGFAEISKILTEGSGDKLPAATKNHYVEYIQGFKDLLDRVNSKKDLTLQNVESEIAKIHEKHNFFAAGGFY